MTILFILACTLGTLLALAKTTNVFLTPGGSGSNPLREDIEKLRHLQRTKDKVLQDLRILELERTTHKVSEEDFIYFRKRFEATALQIIQEINEVRGGDDWENGVHQALISGRNTLNPDIETKVQRGLADAKNTEPSARVLHEHPMGDHP